MKEQKMDSVAINWQSEQNFKDVKIKLLLETEVGKAKKASA